MTSPSDFLSEFSDVPDLDGAACKGRHELFDATVYQGPHKAGEVRIDIGYAREKAMQICATCPAIKSCSEWVDSIPAYRRPAGVVAGQVKFRSNKNGKPLLPGEGGPPKLPYGFYVQGQMED